MRNPLSNIVNNLAATAAPDEDNDVTEGYLPGSIWVDQTNEDVYTCVESAVGAARWLSQKTGDLVGS